MPHLPAVEIRDGSVTVKIPVKEVNARGKVLKTLFKKGEPKTAPYPPNADNLPREQSDIQSPTKKCRIYTYESYTTVEKGAYIYLVEICGVDEEEIFEFRPKDGKCTIKVYHALKEEYDEVQELMNERRWETVKTKLAEADE